MEPAARFSDAAPGRPWDPRGARAPRGFRERALGLFRAPRNVEYLRGLLAARAPPGPPRAFALETLEGAVAEFGAPWGAGGDLFDSDPLAQRGAARPAADLWAEVRRLNLAFFESRLALLRDHAALIGGAGGDPLGDQDEGFAYQMFVADSLRPPGLEALNGAGPYHAPLEDQRAAAPPPGAPLPPAGVSADDWAWGAGDPARTPEQALAEYWGGAGADAPPPGAAPPDGGTPRRFMRYPEIPRWQHTARPLDAVDRDIGETLGESPLERGGPVRGWDGSRVRDVGRDARGMRLAPGRRHGPRHGFAV